MTPSETVANAGRMQLRPCLLMGNIAPAGELKQGPTGKKFTLMPYHSKSSATKVEAKPDRSKPKCTVWGSTPLHSPSMVFIILVKMISHEYSPSATRTFATAPYSCFLYFIPVHPMPASSTQPLTFTNHKPECIHFSELLHLSAQRLGCQNSRTVSSTISGVDV